MKIEVLVFSDFADGSVMGRSTHLLCKFCKALKEKMRIGIIAFKAFTNGVVSHKKAFNFGSLCSSVKIFHSFDGPVLFHRVKKRDIGECEVGFHALEAHSSSKQFNLKE